MPDELVQRTRIAVADAWQAEGFLRQSQGGAAAEFRDVRVMASGLHRPHWNNADVTGPDPDLKAAHAFYAKRGLPWGIRVAGRPWQRGRRVMRQRLMALTRHGFQPAQRVDGLQLALAGPDEIESVAAIDAAAFGEDPQTQRPWIEPHLGAASVETVLATLGGQPVATAYTLRSDGLAGPALYLGGVAVLEVARRHGVAAAMSSRLLQRGFVAGAELAHLHADTERSARVFARLGFHEAGELDVYAVGRLDPIAVKPHDPLWARRFAAAAPTVQDALRELAAGPVEHIGSTAVAGLAAKPIVDMVVPVHSHESGPEIIAALTAAGWSHDPQPDDAEMRRHSFCLPDPAWRTHHLHVVEASSRPWRRWLAFRDHLREHPDEAERYGRLKTDLAERFAADRDAYRAGKTGFVEAALRRGGYGEA